MRTGAFLFAAGISAVAVAAAAFAQPKPSSAPARPHNKSVCFSLSFVDGISADDNRTAYVHVGPSDMYKLDVAPGCQNLDWPMTPKRLGTKNGPEGDICDYTDIVLFVGGHERCFVTGMHKMTKAEIDAWSHKGKPAKH
jgi:hypothetical protein